MMFKTPSFWYRNKAEPAPLIEQVLTPAARLYEIGYRAHQSSIQPQRVHAPVICIGNLNAGGTGKTPTAVALMGLIKKNNLAQSPFFLLRGYGGGSPGPLVVSRTKHTAWDTGDEALILADCNPTVVAADRVAGANLAIMNRADLILMDDGLQNPGIHKDVKIVVINGEMGFGNGKMMPAGPLREPLETGLARADAFLVLGPDIHGTATLLPAQVPLFKAQLVADEAAMPSRDQRYLAFAGLGYPQKFFDFLRNKVGMDIAETISFPDHYPYTEEDLRSLHAKAQEANAQLLTTYKDHLRLPKLDGIDVHVMPVKLAWEDESQVLAFLRSKLDSLR